MDGQTSWNVGVDDHGVSGDVSVPNGSNNGVKFDGIDDLDLCMRFNFTLCKKALFSQKLPLIS